MDFKVLDIEKTPADQFLGRYHTVLSTNYIHATRDLTVSLINIRKTLRPDGFISLVKLTRKFLNIVLFSVLLKAGSYSTMAARIRFLDPTTGNET